jgi:hypothetical protein
VNPSPLRAREIEALTFIYTPTQRSAGAASAHDADTPPRLPARPLVGAAVAAVVFGALAWILTR